MDLLWVYEAFNELQTCRPAGMGVGPIPWTAIHEWATAHEVSDPERFRHFIRAMDGEYLAGYLKRKEQQ